MTTIEPDTTQNHKTHRDTTPTSTYETSKPKRSEKEEHPPNASPSRRDHILAPTHNHKNHNSATHRAEALQETREAEAGQKHQDPNNRRRERTTDHHTQTEREAGAETSQHHDNSLTGTQKVTNNNTSDRQHQPTRTNQAGRIPDVLQQHTQTDT